MCIVSREHLSREMNVNDEATIGHVKNHNYAPQVALVPIHREKDVHCLCAKNGVCLLLAGLPSKFLAQHGLKNADQTVIFHEIGSNCSRSDQVEFIENHKRVRFDELPLKVHVMRIKQPTAESELEEQEEAEPVLVGALHDPSPGGGVGSRFSRSAAKIGLVVAVLAAIAH